jgi:2-oxoglutarate dehydrogenase complex dehydrogenase (E1) component-like enzyme
MKCFQVRILINRYREKGHEKADIDPLHLESSIS